MKELSIEEKAKAYDEAFERAKKWYDANTNEGYRGIFDDIFPELKESEDERIRKEMIEILEKEAHDFPSSVIAEKSNSWIAWLEKQCKETSWKPSKEEMDVLYGLAYITNQYDEHKEEVITRLYQDLKREFFNGSSYENMFPNTEDGVRRRSTIQVLEYARSLDTYNQYGKADIDKNIAWLEKQGKNDMGISEATKQKLKDNLNKALEKETPESWNKFLDEQKSADTEKGAKGNEREIPNSAWSEEDEDVINHLLAICAGAKRYRRQFAGCLQEDITKYQTWLKSLKDKVQPQPKQEWSEEDKEFINDLIGIFDGQQYQAHSDEEIVKWLKSIRLPYNKEWDENNEEMLKSIIATCELACEDRDSSPARHLLQMQTDWLKSLKDRYTWKPSDEQMTQLKKYCPDNRPLTSLYEQLKKLKE